MSRKFLDLSAVLALLLTLGATASAEETRVVSSASIRLSDVVRNLPAEVADADLLPAPAPGSSRLISRQEIQQAAQRNGISLRGLSLPASVRLQSAAKRWSNDDLVSAATLSLADSLPSGVTVRQLKTSAKVVTSPQARLSTVRLPRLPRREGDFSTTVVGEFEHAGEIVARIPFAVTFDISSEAARPVVSKGARVQLVIESGPARVTASAVALSDGELGETLQFQVVTTRKVLFGKLQTPLLAKVVQ